MDQIRQSGCPTSAAGCPTSAGRNWPNATVGHYGIRSVLVEPPIGPAPAEGSLRISYSGVALEYVGYLLGHGGPPLQITRFGSGGDGLPGYYDPPRIFQYDPRTTTINPGLDRVIADMGVGGRRVVVIPPVLAYGQTGFYARTVPGQPRFVISPNTMLVYEVEVLPTE